MAATASKVLETVGISPKAIAAAFAPVLASAGVAVGNWITTGVFDTGEIRIVLAGAVTGVVSGIAAYWAKPGAVTTVKK